METKIGHWYTHKKGGVYRVLHIAYHSETEEEMVVYKCAKTGRIWVRPAEMFEDGRFAPTQCSKCEATVTNRTVRIVRSTR